MRPDFTNINATVEQQKQTISKRRKIPEFQGNQWERPLSDKEFTILLWVYK